MKKLLALLMIVALFSCDKGVGEYIKIKDVYQGQLEAGEYVFPFNMIEAGDFRVMAKLGGITFSEDFVVKGSLLKADTTNTGNPNPTPNPVSTLSLIRKEYLIDEEVEVELVLVSSYQVELAVYKKME
ncbi:MAG: hypothetical protein K9H64_02300 [Bacteroidales bacterium]|nr:hypothetical protein [Bacteroidales bacterium]MCF8454931.1 hypothetical protein [Bacteroidales bacterium]